MPEKEQRKITLKSDDSPHGEGILHVTHYDKNDRTKRALKALGLCWLGAAASIPVVIAHWLLVPGFLIAGPVLAFKRLKQEAVTERAEGHCPIENQDVTLKLEANDTLPKFTYCPACNKSIQLVE